MNNITEAATDEYNHFHRLPNELIAFIFDKICDLKCRLFCSLVSKHFASIIPLVRKVSITANGIANNTQQYMKNVDEFAHKSIHSNGRQLDDLVKSLSLQHLELPVILDNFTELECIHLDYHFWGAYSYAPSPTRTVKFYSDDSQLQSFVYLEYRYMHKSTDSESGGEVHIEDAEYEGFMRAFRAAQEFSMRYYEWVTFMTLVVKAHASVQELTITDSEANVKMVVGDKQCKNDTPDFLDKILKLTSCYDNALSRCGWVPVLQLPSSGYIMHSVTLFILDVPEQSCMQARKFEEKGFCDMDDTLPVLREAVKEILENHQDHIQNSSAKS